MAPRRRVSAATKAKISAKTRVFRGPTAGLDNGTKRSGIGTKGNARATPNIEVSKQGSSSTTSTGQTVRKRITLADLPQRSQRNIVAGSLNRSQRAVHSGDLEKASKAGKASLHILGQTSLSQKTLTNLNVRVMREGQIPVAKHVARKKRG